MAKEKAVKTEVKTEKEILGYTWASGEKEPIYKPELLKEGDLIGYTWASGKKAEIK